jgi:succinate dehydrogenase / fumarate reductase, flavoprotein subunit
MYHQFKQLGDIDITKDPMEVGPTTHYMMGGVKVDPDSQMSKVPGLFAAGECAAGLHGANRLGGNSLSDLLVFGCRAGEYAAEYAKANGVGSVNNDQVEAAARAALAPFDRAGGESPYGVQYELQDMMQDKVGIVRVEAEMQQAVEEIAKLRKRAENVFVPGNREYNNGWHTAMDLPNLLTVSELIARAAAERKESRGAHFRDDYPEKSAECGKFNIVMHKGSDGEAVLTRTPLIEMPAELKQIIEEMK